MVAAVVVLTVDGGGAVAVGLVGGDGRFDGESQRVWTETCQTVEFMREEGCDGTALRKSQAPGWEWEMKLARVAVGGRSTDG